MTEGTRQTYGVRDRAGERAVAATPRGLSSGEAADRLLRDGPNELPRAQTTPMWRTIASQLRDPLILVLMVAAALTLATGDWTDAGVIVLVIVVNTTVGVVQEVKAGRAIAALSELTAPEARVLRDGEQRQVPASEVVCGDVLVLAEGDIVSADAFVVDAAALLVDESALTGESVPVDKAAAGQDGQADELAAGTVRWAGSQLSWAAARGSPRCSGAWQAWAGCWRSPPSCCAPSSWPSAWPGAR